MKFLVSKFYQALFLSSPRHTISFQANESPLVSEPPIIIPNLSSFQMRLICSVLMYNFFNFFFVIQVLQICQLPIFYTFSMICQRQASCMPELVMALPSSLHRNLNFKNCLELCIFHERGQLPKSQKDNAKENTFSSKNSHGQIFASV